MTKRLIGLLDPVLQSAAGTRAVTAAVRLWASAAARLAPADGLKRLLELDALLQARIDRLAIDLDGGVHAKHRLTGYHDFFVKRVHAGERILDVGCGKGELANDMAVRGGAQVVGIDVNRWSLAFAREHFDAPEFVEGDVLTADLPGRFDVVVLSNVLEHIGPRVDVLRRLHESTGATRFLIRVPSAERDWLVPLRQELGLPFFSDPTHETEYTPELLEHELRAAGLTLEELVQRWGELWAVARG